jgi:hypothetical protein
MSGNPGAFVNGNMFMGLLGPGAASRLPERDRQQLPAGPGAGPFGPRDRPMAGHVTIPAGWPAGQVSHRAGKSRPTRPACRRRSQRQPPDHAADRSASAHDDRSEPQGPSADECRRTYMAAELRARPSIRTDHIA